MLEAVANADPGLITALAAEGLPTSDLVATHKVFRRILRGVMTAGYVGLELYGDAALLRSLVVLPAFKGQGVGRNLVAAAIQEAGAREVRSVWLLTNTAQPFFAKLDWQVCERGAAPEAVRASEEFASLCPTSAVCMTWTIDA